MSIVSTLVAEGELKPSDLRRYELIIRKLTAEEQRENRYGIYRAVDVDGVTWGWVRRHQRGRHGSEYTFAQKHGQEIMCPAPTPRDEHRMKTFEVPGTKMHNRELGRSFGQRNKPDDLPERLLFAARQLVEGGYLIHPDVQQERVAARHRLFAENEAKAEASKDRAFKEMARAALGPLVICKGADDAVTRIVLALKTAQTM